MAKGQKRSNREIRKPKQAKAAPKPENLLGSQVKNATRAGVPGAKGKKG